MKKKMLSLFLAFAMVITMAAPALAAEESEGGKIVILHTNDVHCGIDQAKNEEGEVTNMGYAGVAAYKTAMETEYGAGNVTLVDAGDAIQGGPIGTLSKGAYIVDIMNEVGYDLAIPGNHEFDYGMENFLSLAKEKAEYEYLCANFTDLEGNPVLEGYKVLTYGDVKVGYVGIDTPESFTKSTPTYFQDAEGNYIYSFCQGNEGADLYNAVQKAVDAARAEGADYVVALGHLGIDEQSSPWTSTEVIANTTGIDVLIDGHSHSTFEKTEKNKDGEDVVVAQTGTKLENLGKVVIDTATGEITSELVAAKDCAAEDEATAAFVKGINDEFAEVLKKVVAKTDVELTTKDTVTGERAVRSAETNLGDLCADAYRVMLDADVAFVNGGGVRADIPAGDITYEQIINVHPFGNEACVVETTGQDILDALEMGARVMPEENGGFLQVSGLTYTIDTSIPSSVVLNDEKEFVKVEGERRVKDVLVNGAPIDPEKTYTLASHNYMLKSGGDGFVMFKDDPLLKDCVMIDNQVLINYIVDELGGVVSEDYADPAGQGRIKVTGTPAETPEEPETADWADVDADAWYAEAVHYVIENGIMGSTSTEAKVFTPNGMVTRATVFQTLYNAQGKPEVGETTFADVKGKWYASAAAWAEEVGLAVVPTDGGFYGERAITRAEIATIFARYAELEGKIVTDGDLSAYTDVADVADWAADGMRVAVGSGIIGGKPGNLLDPNGTAVRTELATILMNYAKLSSGYSETYVEIEVPETDGIPAHTIPGVLTVPDEGAYAAVVMLHGTGSNKDEAGNGYATAAPLMALQGLATLRIDFMGNGDSTASYSDYCYTSANIDAKAAADYLTAELKLNNLAVMGWSQGGTNALLAAAAYPDTFKAVITWAGAMRLSGANFFEDYDAAYETAKKEGSVELTFDWRDPLPLGLRWFEESLSTDKAAEVAKITGPILAINGLADTTVTPDNADQIVAASKNENSRTYFIENCDHTFNVFSGDDTALTDAIYAGIGFLENTFNGGIGAGVTSVSKYGNVTTNIPAYQFAGAGFELGDILNVTVGDTTVQAPYGDAYSNVDNGNVVILADGDGYVTVAINMGNFSGTYGAEVGSYLEFTMAEKAGYLEEYEIRNIDSLRTNERDDYASDEVFANFRPVVMGDIPAGILYRSSSPVNPELGRNSYADKLAEAAGIKTVLNLADSLEVLEAYEGYAGTYYATLNVVPLDMGVDFAAEEFNAKLKTGLVYLIDNEGPYLIHCNEGKDRAGFVAALLEALGGAEAEEIVEDYMLSYENYYHVEHHSDRWYSIANSNIIKTLCTLTGTETKEEMKQADLRQAAETYLMGTVGLTAEQVAAVRTAITTPVTAEAAA